MFLFVGQQKYVIPAALHSQSTEIVPLLRPNRNHTFTNTCMHPWNLDSAGSWAKRHKDLLSVCAGSPLLLTSFESQPIITAVQSQRCPPGLCSGPAADFTCKVNGDARFDLWGLVGLTQGWTEYILSAVGFGYADKPPFLHRSSLLTRGGKGSHAEGARRWAVLRVYQPDLAAAFWHGWSQNEWPSRALAGMPALIYWARKLGRALCEGIHIHTVSKQTSPHILLTHRNGWSHTFIAIMKASSTRSLAFLSMTSSSAQG